MKSIFKKTSGSPAADDKVAQYNFRDHYPDVNLNLPWNELSPYIRQATKNFVLPYIGKPLYDDLCTKIEAGAALTAEQSETVEMLRDAIAFYAITVILPKKKTAIASMGAVENVATEGTTSASQWGFRTTLWSVSKEADIHLDNLLSYLETMVRTGVAYFNLWKNDPAFELGNSDLFRTTLEFQKYRGINMSRRTFVGLAPILRQAQKQHIIPVVSQVQFDAIKAAYRSNTLSPQQELLLDQIRAALSAWAIYYAADRMPVIPDQDGFRVIGNADAVDSKAYAAEVVQSAIANIKNGAEQDARTNTADLTAFLAENKADYPLWAASSSNPANDTTYLSRPFGSDYGAVML